MRTGSTGSDDGKVRPLQIEHDRKITGDHVDDRAWYEKRGYSTRARCPDNLCVLFYLPYAANTRANCAADTWRHLLRNFQAAVAHGLNAGRHAELNKLIHLARVFQRQILRDIEVFYTGAEARGECGHIEAFDGCSPALAR